jgi:hypothetical protein
MGGSENGTPSLLECFVRMPRLYGCMGGFDDTTNKRPKSQLEVEGKLLERYLKIMFPPVGIMIHTHER